LFGTLLLMCSIISSVQGATVVIALIGFNWATTNWVPFAIASRWISCYYLFRFALTFLLEIARGPHSSN
jgi:hypothetical protein